MMLVLTCILKKDSVFHIVPYNSGVNQVVYLLVNHHVVFICHVSKMILTNPLVVLVIIGS
jgi:hypothetical protein